MSDITITPDNKTAATPKKARLGRGLGSLLGSSSISTERDQLDSQKNTTNSHADKRMDSQMDSQVGHLTSQKLNLNSQADALAGHPQMVVSIQDQSASRAADLDKKKTSIENELTRIWQIPVDCLMPNTQQPRQIFDQTALKELAASIKEKGILQPITARRLSERNFEIIAGERRWRAAQLAGLLEVPVILKRISEQDSLELAIIENIQRENLNPMEESEAYDMLMREYNLTQQQCAEKVGKERATIANSLRLLVLPMEIKLMVRKDELSAGHAKALLSVEGSEKQIEIAKLVMAQKLSVRATEKLAAKSKRSTSVDQDLKAGLGPEINIRLVDSLSAELQKLMKTKVAIDYASGKGKISIAFYSDEELSNLVEKFRHAWRK